MSSPDMEATLREARADVLAISNRSSDPETKRLADAAYKKLSAILRGGEE